MEFGLELKVSNDIILALSKSFFSKELLCKFKATPEIIKRFNDFGCCFVFAIVYRPCHVKMVKKYKDLIHLYLKSEFGFI